MPSLEIPDIPNAPEELEDFVAALFQAAGYFVERNVRESDRTAHGTLHVLEMDVVATMYDDGKVETIVAEAKSGDWGLSDIFKLLGWLTYLGQRRGAFFVSREMESRNAVSIRERFAPLGIELFVLGDCADVHSRFETSGFAPIRDTGMVDHWRFACVGMRKLMKHLGEAIKSNTAPTGGRTALDYHKVINDEIFFEADAKARLRKIYAEFSRHPKLSLFVANELSGSDFASEPTEGAHACFRQAMYDGKHAVLQACFYIEHRARLAILKAAVDYFCAGEPAAGSVRLAVQGIPEGFIEIPMEDWLPTSFHAGYAELREHAYFRRYPLFWQVFLWGFGGFYLVDREEEEFQLLSDQTGIPVAEIPRALTAFDKLFPLVGTSWLVKPSTSHCRVLKTFPVPLRGLGANYRLACYGKRRYRDFGYADYTELDLAKWHLGAYRLLESPLGPQLTLLPD